MKRLAVVCSILWAVAPAHSQKLNPVKWQLEFSPPKAAPGAAAAAKLTATLDEGWHLYSLTTPKGGPNPTTIALAENEAVEKVEVYQPKPERKFDPNFSLDTETYEKQAVFHLLVTVKKEARPGPLELTANLRYQACTDKICLPPVKKQAAATLTLDPAAPPAEAKLPDGYVAVRKAPPAPSTPPAAGGQAAAAVPNAREGLLQFLLIAFGLGLAAVFTPCVFPMIPMTLSYFLNRESGSRAESLIQASTFCGGIIVLFTALGMITTLAVGPIGVVKLGSSPIVNTFIAAVFLAFSFSLLGAFEITLPSGLVNRMDQVSRRGGLLGTLLMGLTFSLTSFACVGPFVGSLLAASVQGDKLQPLLGMASFAAGLSSPFFFLVLFPSGMKKLPRSGGWLPRVKIVMGFVLLAVSIKYLSNIDVVMQWNFITRERFLAAWVVLFALPGLYLLGFLRLEGIKPDATLGVARALIGAAFLIFSISLLPGMFGARLGELDAYVPPPAAGAGGLAGSRESELPWLKNGYREALARAKQENKLLLVDFTGYACTNCKWMKANMFPRPEIAGAVKDFLLVELYTDGSDAESERNQQLQQQKFGTIAIPFYAILDGDEKVIATFPGITKKPEEFLSFLKSGSAPLSAEVR